MRSSNFKILAATAVLLIASRAHAQNYDALDVELNLPGMTAKSADVDRVKSG